MDNDTTTEDRVRRDRIAKLSLTEAEHAEIKAKAEAEGLDVATFARRSTLLAARVGAQGVQR